MANKKEKKVTPFRLCPETRERLKNFERSIYNLAGRWPDDQDDLFNMLMDLAEKPQVVSTDDSQADSSLSGSNQSKLN